MTLMLQIMVMMISYLSYSLKTRTLELIICTECIQYKTFIAAHNRTSLTPPGLTFAKWKIILIPFLSRIVSGGWLPKEMKRKSVMA